MTRRTILAAEHLKITDLEEKKLRSFHMIKIFFSAKITLIDRDLDQKIDDLPILCLAGTTSVGMRKETHDMTTKMAVGR